jgi:hypothetical protein
MLRDIKNLHILSGFELFQAVRIPVLYPVCGGTCKEAVMRGLGRSHINYVLVPFEKEAGNGRGAKIGASNCEYANVANSLAVRRRLRKCGR